MEITEMTLTDLENMKDTLYSDFDNFWSYNVLKKELGSVEENNTCGERGIQQAKKFNWRNEAEKLICFLGE